MSKVSRFHAQYPYIAAMCDETQVHLTVSTYLRKQRNMHFPVYENFGGALTPSVHFLLIIIRFCRNLHHHQLAFVLLI